MADQPTTTKPQNTHVTITEAVNQLKLIANWLHGQDKTAALKQINRIEQQWRTPQ